MWESFVIHSFNGVFQHNLSAVVNDELRSLRALRLLEEVKEVDSHNGKMVQITALGSMFAMGIALPPIEPESQ